MPPRLPSARLFAFSGSLRLGFGSLGFAVFAAAVRTHIGGPAFAAVLGANVAMCGEPACNELLRAVWAGVELYQQVDGAWQVIDTFGKKNVKKSQ